MTDEEEEASISDRQLLQAAAIKHLQSHVDGLIKIKAPVYWYGRGWEDSCSKICVLMNVKFPQYDHMEQAEIASSRPWVTTLYDSVCVDVLIDDQLCLIRLDYDDIEIIK